jgi:hypothetical protein
VWEAAVVADIGSVLAHMHAVPVYVNHLTMYAHADMVCCTWPRSLQNIVDETFIILQ